jgi:ribosomal protein L28
MGKRCDCCRRSSTKGASRSHSKVKTLKRQHINLQTRNIEGIKVKVCTACLRTLTKDERMKEKQATEVK